MSRDILLEKIQVLEELKKRRELAINKYTPTDVEGHSQLSFHKSSATIRLVLGGNRSGKSVSTAAEAAWWASGTHPYLEQANKRPNKIWIISNEYRTIFEGTWRHLRPDADKQPSPGVGFLPPNRTRLGPKIIGHELPSYVEVKHGNAYIDANGNRTYGLSRIDFISADKKESGRRKTQAAAVDLIIIDEEIDDSVFSELLMRILDNDGKIAVSATLIRAEEWLLNLEDKFISGDKNIHLTRLDTLKNPYIKEEAKAKILSQLTEEEKEIRVKGLSTRESGLVYKEFNKTHVIEPFTIPTTWQIFYILDPGFRTFAVLWAAFDPEKKLLYLIDELYLHNSTLHTVAASITSNPYYHYPNKTGLIDPAAMRSLETGEPGIASQLMTHYNIITIPAFNAVDAGIQAVHDLFKTDLLLNIPRLRAFNTLNNFFKEIRQYRLKKDTSSTGMHEQKDEPLRKKNHLMDCMKYLCLYLHPVYMLTKQKKVSSFQKPFQRKFNHDFLGSEF